MQLPHNICVGAVAFVDEEVERRLDIQRHVDVRGIECGLLGTCTGSPMQKNHFQILVMHGALLVLVCT
jgi:hypothetical protein